MRGVAKWQGLSLAQVSPELVQCNSISDIQAIWDRFNWAKILGVNNGLLAKFGIGNSLDLQSDLLKNAIRAKFDDREIWASSIQDFKNILSSKLRDALCSFVIFHKGLRDKNFGFKDRESLYQYFLLDVGMGDCFTLPPVVAMTNSLQVYVHRCLMGLEISADEKTVVLLDLDEMEEWEWRKNYRVWEANRKIFLWPENYAEPSIRDNKSPEFKELEDELLQQKLSAEVVEDAYKKYIEQIMILAELRMAGAYYDKANNQIFIFGRTNKQPKEFYMRSLEFLDSGGVIWSNWEKMNVSIPSDDISAIRHNGKLHIFWTSFQRKDISSINSGNSEINQHTYDVFLNYSYKKVDGKWSAPQRVEMDYRKNSPFDPFLRIDKYENLINNANTPNPSFKSGADAVRENALKQFEQIVYKKPYPIALSDKKNLKFGYIWTDQKDALEPRYKKTTATIDAFTVSIKLRVDVVVFEFEQDLEFSLDRLDRVVSTATSYNQEEPPVNLTISPLEYKYQFGSDILILRLEFIKSNSGSFQYSLKTLGNGNNKIIFFKEPNKEVKSGSVNIFHQIDYVPVSEIEFKEEFVDMARQSTYSGSGGLSTMKILLNPEYASYYDNFSNFYVTDGSSAFTYPSLASKIQQKDMISVLTTPSNPDPNSGYELNPQNIQLLWNKISLGIESLMDTQSSQRHLVNQIDYSKSFGNYFFELFFHIPMRIADHLNASGKYKEANYWYGFIYNPTAIKDKFEQLAFPYDVNWRFAAFRNISMQKLKDMYSDPNTIEMYRRNPGNPHAIARMRLAAYQKHVVMKYLDNLLDWADNLFEQYTPESTSEARNLYSTVKTILGQKPQTTGDCLVPNDFTYNDIKDTGANEFLYNLFISPNSGTAGIMKMNSMTLAEDEEEEFVYTPNTHRAKTSSAKYVSKMNAKASAHKKAKKPFTDVKSTTVGRPKVKDMAAIRVDSRYSTLKPVKGLHRPNLSLPYFDLEKDLAFCFPHNQDFINYWDRVDDRIYKLNHCLDINGVRKVMPAYAPPIDPMLLARMVAGGLSFDEIAGALNAKLPNHRFSFLIERAKQYAGVVQNFGQSLFAAIEKKDAEELTLIRARHEVNILNLSTQLKKQQIEQAKVSLKIVQENKKGIEIRKAHFENLVNEGLTSWEIAQQVSKHVATGIKLAESVVHFSAAITYLIPQVGSPFAMKYGGQELGHSGVEFAEWAGSMAQIAEAISSSAALEAGNQRREQDWQHQVENLAQDLVGLNEQVRNAEIAVQVAELDLELHLKNIEQYEELFEFYTTKFAGFDHYTFLVRELQRLYRMAYNMANDVAIQAQAAFEFERRGVEGVMGGFVQSNNWNNERIGLLAGENLLLQLMQMEQEFYNTDKRKIEITQHFSLLQIAPEKLLELKITGEFSGFTIPEAAFDLVYPGYFRRIIKSVRISIPCIAGPYTNIGATLTLGTNKIRTRTTDDLIDFNFTGCETIATSSAQNDGGQFELNFRDERYLPFEGAGAVSSWTLSLPKSIRPFDYNSISDIVFHVSYTAEYDGVFKNEVEGNLKVALNSLNGAGLTRIFSLRYDFPREWNLLSDSNNSDDMILELRREHFPYFASVDKIKSIGSKVFTQQPDNLWVEETDNLGITKQGNMKVVIPAAVGDNSLKDLIFIVTYDCK
jgi:hypothetical protein